MAETPPETRVETAAIQAEGIVKAIEEVLLTLSDLAERYLIPTDEADHA